MNAHIYLDDYYRDTDEGMLYHLNGEYELTRLTSNTFTIKIHYIYEGKNFTARGYECKKFHKTPIDVERNK